MQTPILKNPKGSSYPLYVVCTALPWGGVRRDAFTEMTAPEVAKAHIAEVQGRCGMGDQWIDCARR